jgi:hypothetical protein
MSAAPRDYAAIINGLKPGLLQDSLILRFVGSGDPLSWIIRAVSRAPQSRGASHVEMLSPNRLWLGARDNGGFKERPLDYTNPSWERWYALPSASPAQFADGMAYAMSLVGTPYNFLAIAGLLLDVNLTNANDAICSQAMFNVAQRFGHYMLNVEPGEANLVTPTALHMSKDLLRRNVYCYPALKLTA